MPLNDLTWQLVLDAERFSNTGISNTLRMQFATYEATKHLGPALPMALYPGQEAIKPLIFTTAGEAIERMSGRLLSERA